MIKVGVAILGFGTVGSGTYNILIERRKQIALEYGVDVEVRAILERDFDRAVAIGAPADLVVTNLDDILVDGDISIVAECIGGVNPVLGFLTKCLEAGKSIVTANKEMLSKHFVDLEKAAAKTNAGIYFEATCVGGVPIIRTLTQAMQANKILELKGIINGTTNYILSRMTAEGASYDDVLADAQRLGYAEANPSADVDGYDAMYKIGILSSLAFNKYLPINLIYREGITDINIADIEYAKQFGYVIKLLAIAKQIGDKIEARVHPVMLKCDHPLSNVLGSFNAVFLKGDNVDDIMLYGRGAGSLPTGSAVVSDIVFAARQQEHARYQEMLTSFDKSEIINDFESEYYLRLSVKDVAGVLAKIASILSVNGVSITNMRQDGGEGNVQMIFFTHKAKESNVNNALNEIKQLPQVINVEAKIRVEK